jgi:hypothetical protein
MSTNSGPNITAAEPSGYSIARRSQRIWLTMPIRVAFSVADQVQWTEETSTLIVNAHGALILLRNEVQVGQSLTLSDVRTNKRRDCRVVTIGAHTANMKEVGVELLEPFNDFWRVLDPPKDWAQFREGGRRSIEEAGTKPKG